MAILFCGVLLDCSLRESWYNETAKETRGVEILICKGGRSMDYLNHNIAVNLKRIRQAKGYTLDTAAEQTGVSKSMLGQIERGEANPTISLLGKILSGLRVELSDLVKTPGDRVYRVSKEKLIPTKELQDKYKVYTYFPYEKESNIELYTFEIQPGSSYFSGTHGENTEEYVIVEQGVLTLSVGGTAYCVKEGDAVRFDTDRDHEYQNRGSKLLKIVCVFHYSA